MKLQKKQHSPMEHYLEIEKIGKGSFSTVQKVLNTKDNKFYAMKVIVFRKVATRLRGRFLNESLKKLTERAFLLAQNEQQILQLFSNTDNVMNLIDFNYDRQMMMIIMPLMNFGALLSPKYKKETNLGNFINETDAKLIFKNIAIGLHQSKS